MARRTFSLAPFNRNAVLQLIAANGVGFVLYKLVWVCFIVFNKPENHVLAKEATDIVAPYVALTTLRSIAEHWWTVATYAWVHESFFGWVSNMLWVYCFGTIVQSLVGYRQVIPIFIYGTLGGAAVCLLAQLMPIGTMPAGFYLMGAQAGVMALAAASLTIAPKYRLYLGETLSIPLIVVFAIYLAFFIASYSSVVPFVAIALGGLFSGFVYASFLKKGYQPGAFAYRFFDRMNKLATPDPMRGVAGNRRKKVLEHTATRHAASQQRVDDILDKINHKGYSSLTQEEKEILVRASQETKD